MHRGGEILLARFLHPKESRGLVAGKRAGTHRLEARTVLALATAERDMEAEMAAMNGKGT